MNYSTRPKWSDQFGFVKGPIEYPNCFTKLSKTDSATYKDMLAHNKS